MTDLYNELDHRAIQELAIKRWSEFKRNGDDPAQTVANSAILANHQPRDNEAHAQCVVCGDVWPCPLFRSVIKWNE